MTNPNNGAKPPENTIRFRDSLGQTGLASILGTIPIIGTVAITGSLVLFLTITFLKIIAVDPPTSRLGSIGLGLLSLFLAYKLTIPLLRGPTVDSVITEIPPGIPPIRTGGDKEAIVGHVIDTPAAGHLSDAPLPKAFHELIEEPRQRASELNDEGKRQFALSEAAKNQAKFANLAAEPDAIIDRQLRHSGDDHVELKSLAELRLVASEPWTFMDLQLVRLDRNAVFVELLDALLLSPQDMLHMA